MITIEKGKVAEWMLFSYLAEQNYYKEKILLFEEKYQSDFENFEKDLNNLDHENFNKWDDYISWKAFRNLNFSIDKMIKDVRLGNFKVA